MSKQPIELRGEIQKSDVENMVEWLNDEEVTRYLNEKPGMANSLRNILKQACQVLTPLFNTRGRFFMVDHSKFGPIGYLRLVPKGEKKAEMVIAIGEKDKWNEGYGTRAVWEGLKIAFFNMRFDKVEAKIHKKNKASKKIFTKVGFWEKRQECLEMTMSEFLKTVASV